MTSYMLLKIKDGSAWYPVILPVFKTGGRRLSASPVGSTPTRFRQILSMSYEEYYMHLRVRPDFKIGLL